MDSTRLPPARARAARAARATRALQRTGRPGAGDAGGVEAGGRERPLRSEPETREETRCRLQGEIRELHREAGALTRVHRTHTALYAQARRAFGSWQEAVAAAGLDYQRERHQSLRRGLLLRDQRRASWRALSRFLLEQPGADDATLERDRPELAGRVRRCWGDLAGALAWAERGRAARAAGAGVAPPPESAHAAAES